MTFLPNEIWSFIFFHVENPTELSKTCKSFHHMMHSPFMIAQWIVYRYSRSFAFMGACHWWLLKNKRKKHFCARHPCPLEDVQIQVGEHLIQMNVNRLLFEEFVLKEAAQMHHMRYVEWILSIESLQDMASHQPFVFRSSLLLESIKNKGNEQFIELLISNGAVHHSKVIEMAIENGCSMQHLQEMLHHQQVSCRFILSAMANACRYKFIPFTSKKYKHLIDSACILLESLPLRKFELHQVALMNSASELGSVKMMRQLIEKGGDMYHEESTPIFTALIVGNIAMLRFLKSLGPFHVNMFTWPRIALIALCLIDHLTIFYGLLTTSASVIATFICYLRGERASTLNGISFDLSMGLCLPTNSSTDIVSQQVVGFLCIFALFVIMQLMMPFTGMISSLILVYKHVKRSKRVNLLDTQQIAHDPV